MLIRVTDAGKGCSDDEHDVSSSWIACNCKHLKHLDLATLLYSALYSTLENIKTAEMNKEVGVVIENYTEQQQKTQCLSHLIPGDDPFSFIYVYLVDILCCKFTRTTCILASFTNSPA